MEHIPGGEPPDRKPEAERLEAVRQNARRELAKRLGILREMANGHNPPKTPPRRRKK